MMMQAVDNMSFRQIIDGDDRGTFVGTPLYVAPEMLNQNMSGPFTDLWAMGCIIFYCLTGAPPFNGSNSGHVF